MEGRAVVAVVGSPAEGPRGCFNYALRTFASIKKSLKIKKQRMSVTLSSSAK